MNPCSFLKVIIRLVYFWLLSQISHIHNADLFVLFVLFIWHVSWMLVTILTIVRSSLGNQNIMCFVYNKMPMCQLTFTLLNKVKKKKGLCEVLTSPIILFDYCVKVFLLCCNLLRTFVLFLVVAIVFVIMLRHCKV